MLSLNQKQLNFEKDALKRLLGFMMEENARMKYRLSEVLRDSSDNKLLENLEGFQSAFINEDELIRLLRHDIMEIEQMLAAQIVEDDHTKRNVDNKLNNLRRNILKTEKHFGDLKLDFNKFLAKNI